jgi:hypothetical protein
MILKLNISVAVRGLLRGSIAKQHALNFEEITLRWEVQSTVVKQFYASQTIKLFYTYNQV